MGRHVTLHWTKAHIGTIGNERADEGAKQGGLLEAVAEVFLPKTEMKAKLEEYFYNVWEDEWLQYPRARMTKLFYSKPDKNQGKYVLKLGRLELSRFIKIITGHNGLFYFKSKIDELINSECRFCLSAEETFYHLATDCPVHRQSREEIFLDKPPITNTKWSVRALLIFSQASGVREALDGDTDLHMFGEDHNWDSTTSSTMDQI